MVGIPTIGDRHHSISRDLHLDFSGFPLWDRWPYRIYCGPLRMWTRSSNMFHQPLRGASMSRQTSSGVDEIDGWVTVSWTHHSTKSFDDWYIPRVLWIAPTHTHLQFRQMIFIHRSFHIVAGGYQEVASRSWGWDGLTMQGVVRCQPHKLVVRDLSCSFWLFLKQLHSLVFSFWAVLSYNSLIFSYASIWTGS